MNRLPVGRRIWLRLLGRAFCASALALSLAAFNPVDPARYQNAADAFDRRDFETAYFEFKVLAEETGDARAQNRLGLLYYNGWGVTKSYPAAVAWITRAAEQGLPDAQTNLGIVHNEGLALPRNAGFAAKWFARAAEQGDPRGQVYLGMAYAAGAGVPLDERQAMAWFSSAAELAPPGNLRDLAIKSRAIVADRIAKRNGVAPSVAVPPRTIDAPRPTGADLVRETQSLLVELGLYDGQLDGLTGPATTRGVRQYQQTRGLKVTGKADAVLLEIIRAERDEVARLAQQEAERRQREAARLDAERRQRAAAEARYIEFERQRFAIEQQRLQIERERLEIERQRRTDEAWGGAGESLGRALGCGSAEGVAKSDRG